MKKISLAFLLLFSITLIAQEKEAVDWKTKCNNKVKEIEEVIIILNPVVEFLTDAFKNNTFSETTAEDWSDAVNQFTTANKHYEKAKAWMAEGKYNKLTFLKLEEAWQYYVKTGVAGIRTKSMVEQELSKK